MTVTVIAAGAGVAALTDSWRIPREQVQALRDGVSLLRESDRRLATSLSEIEFRKASARRAGFALGREEGRRLAAEESAAALAALGAEKVREIAALQESVGHLALEIVRRVAGELDAGVLLPALVDRAVREVLPDQPVSVRVPPQLVGLVETRLFPINGAIEVVGDPDLTELDCVLETANGRVQASLEAQLAALERAFAQDAAR